VIPSVRTKTPHFADRMLTAAARLFGTHRFHEVRMEDIAAEADVSKGTLYRYFKDKDELYVALVARCSRSLVALLRERVEGVEGPRARLAAFVEALLAYFDAQPHLFDLIQRAEVLRGPGQAFPWQLARDEAQRLAQAIFQEGQQAGEFRVRDPEQAALMLLGGIRAIIRFGKQPRPADVGRRIVGDFLHGVAAREE
jgi:AcrR family transcriptional regulator